MVEAMSKDLLEITPASSGTASKCFLMIGVHSIQGSRFIGGK